MSDTLCDKLAAHFQQHAGEWIDGMALSRIAGQYAWRSRVSDLRKRGMVIENRVRRVTRRDCRCGNPACSCHAKVSEYRYVPAMHRHHQGAA